MQIAFVPILGAKTIVTCKRMGLLIWNTCVGKEVRCFFERNGHENWNKNTQRSTKRIHREDLLMNNSKQDENTQK